MKWLMADLPRMTEDLVDDCGAYASSGVAGLRSSTRDSQRAWREVQSICRSELAQFGFDC